MSSRISFFRGKPMDNMPKHRYRKTRMGQTPSQTTRMTDWLTTIMIAICFAAMMPVDISGGTLAAIAQTTSQTAPNTLKVEADQQLEWRRDDQQYIARGNAVLTTQEMTFKAETITADYTNTPDNDTGDNEGGKNRIISITGTGNADIIYRDAQGQETHGQAEMIHYDRQGDILTLTGVSASGVIRVTRNGDMTEAKESITYNRASGVITNIGDTATRFTDGRQIFGDQAVTTIDAENGGINTITVTGNARILHPDQNGTIQEATGDHAFYDAAADTVTVTGNVILTEADNILKGSKAVMKIGEGTSVLSADVNTNRVSGQFILE